MRIASCLLVLSVFGSSLLPAAELAGARLGTWISGPKVGKEDLNGKVVIFDYWGIHCGPCLANIPHVAEMAKLASTDRLVVIANQCQENGKTASVWRANGGTDAPTVIDDGSLKAANVTGLPRMFVFDHTGKQVFDGRPEGFSAKDLQKLLDAVPGPLYTKGEYKECATEAAVLASKAPSVGRTIKTLRTKAEKGSAEAKQLLAGVEAYATRQLAAITADRTGDPARAAVALSTTTALLKGDDSAKPFEDLTAELRKDKAFLNEIAAAEALAKIKAVISKSNLSADNIPAGKRNELVQVVQALDGLAKRYPGTHAGTAAGELRTSLAH